MNKPEYDTHNPTRFIHRLIHWRYRILPDFILNPAMGVGADEPGREVSTELLRILRALEGEAIDPKTGQIAYGRLPDSPIYEDFRRCAAVLPRFDPTDLPDHSTRLAFWINLYNALIIDAVIQFKVRDSVNDAPGFFWRAAYRIGGLRYNAFDIEYGILRGNRGHPAIPGPQFGLRDPRRNFTLSHLDPRVHFSLVCASRSCPPIGVYHSDRIDAQLEVAARSFINNGGVEIDVEKNIVHLSKIFQWYAPDFGGLPLAVGDKRPLLDYVARYLVDDDDRRFLQGGKPRFLFQKYDWRLNGLPTRV